MELNEVLKILGNFAPFSLSDDYCKAFGEYDNSGVIIDSGNSVDGVLYSLDFSLKAVLEAAKFGANLLVTHHPAIYRGIDRLNRADPRSQAIARCLRGRISVVSMHLNLDIAPEGIDFQLMKALGGENATIMDSLGDVGYGRAYKTPVKKLSALAAEAEKTFSTKHIMTFGEDKTVKKIASFCGAGCDEKAVAFAVANKADLVVSSDLKHHIIAELCARGISVMQITHYAAENYGFKKFAAKIKKQLSVPSAVFTDKDLI